MKSTVLVLFLVMVLASTCVAQAPVTEVVVYPSTVQSMVGMWSALLEVCSDTGIPAYDVHVQDMDASNVVIKLGSKWYVPFILSCEKKLTVTPMLRVDQQAGSTTSYATFQLALDWPTNVVTTLDAELSKLKAVGVPIEKKQMNIYIIAVGAIELDKVLEYMRNKQTKVPTAAQVPVAITPSVVPEEEKVDE